MLALPGLATVVALFVLVVTCTMSPLVALIAVPVAAALAGGFGLGTANFIVLGRPRRARSDQGQTGVRPRSNQGQTGVRPGSD